MRRHPPRMMTVTSQHHRNPPLAHHPQHPRPTTPTPTTHPSSRISQPPSNLTQFLSPPSLHSTS
jgi:hypothetical protein